VGECWSESHSADGHIEIMISPVLDDPMRVAGTLAHELVHATGRHAHGSHFAKLAGAIGLEGKMTATTEGEAFKQAAARYAKQSAPTHTPSFPRRPERSKDEASQAAMPDLPLYGADHREMAR
jgi:hypothetical protein